MYDALSRVEAEGKLSEEARAKKLSKQAGGLGGFNDDVGYGGYSGGYRGNFTCFSFTKNFTKSSFKHAEHVFISTQSLKTCSVKKMKTLTAFASNFG